MTLKMVEDDQDDGRRPERLCKITCLLSWTDCLLDRSVDRSVDRSIDRSIAQLDRFLKSPVNTGDEKLPKLHSAFWSKKFYRSTEDMNKRKQKMAKLLEEQVDTSDESDEDQQTRKKTN